MTTKNKWIIGIVSFIGLAVLTRKWWMPNSITLNVKQDTVTSSGGDAKGDDEIGQKYTLLRPYNAMTAKTFKNVDLNKGTVFFKKSDRNGTMLNGQDAIGVFLAPSGEDEFIIPTTILKKA
jgi:hypothetical protein